MQGNDGRGVGALWAALKHPPAPRRASRRPGRRGSRGQRADCDRAHRRISSPWWTSRQRQYWPRQADRPATGPLGHPLPPRPAWPPWPCPSPLPDDGGTAPCQHGRGDSAPAVPVPLHPLLYRACRAPNVPALWLGWSSAFHGPIQRADLRTLPSRRMRWVSAPRLSLPGTGSRWRLRRWAGAVTVPPTADVFPPHVLRDYPGHRFWAAGHDGAAPLPFWPVRPG